MPAARRWRSASCSRPAPASGASARTLTAPIFEGGTLLHQERAAQGSLRCRRREQYRSTVLTAFQNVADTLTALEQDAEGAEGRRRRRRCREVTLDLVATPSARRLRRAISSLLNAEQAYQQARIALVQAQANRYADTAALFQALGGGWWHRADLGRGTTMKTEYVRSDARRDSRRRAAWSPRWRARSPAVRRMQRSQAAGIDDAEQRHADGRAAASTSISTPSRRRHSTRPSRPTASVDFDNDQATSVLAPFSGPVSRLLVSPGDQVKKGEALAMVDSPDFAAAIGAYRKADRRPRSNARRLADMDKDLLAAQRRFAARSGAGGDRRRQRRSRPRRRAAGAGRRSNVDPQTIKDIQAGQPIAPHRRRDPRADRRHRGGKTDHARPAAAGRHHAVLHRRRSFARLGDGAGVRLRSGIGQRRRHGRQ